MNKLIYILLFLTPVLSAQDYWVTPRGNDSNAGTDSSSTGAWATWQKAFDTADAGDTVYFRGGVWYPSSFVAGSSVTTIDPTNAGGYGAHGNSGTFGNPVVYMAYPDDYANGDFPTLDCKDLTAPATNISGITIKETAYTEFKGLHIRHCWQKGNGAVSADGWVLQDCDGVIRFENTASYEHGGAGYQIGGYDTLYFVNNDAYLNCDTASSTPGNHADGVRLQEGGTVADTFKITYFYGNRAWWNSDDGYDLFVAKQVKCYDNWAFLNGSVGGLNGEGNGFKWTYTVLSADTSRLVYNNITAYNKYAHFTSNIYETQVVGQYWNNTSWKDSTSFIMGSVSATYCVDNPNNDVRYYNNLVFDPLNDSPTWGNVGSCDDGDGWPYYVSLSNNTFMQYHPWSGQIRENTDYTVTNADFITVDSTTIVNQLLASRQSDGLLPTLTTAFHLSPTSDLIDAGVDVGLTYYGTAPDIGAYQYNPDADNPTILYSGQSGGKTVRHNGKTVIIRQ